MERERPKVGVGVMIWKDGKVLLGKRIQTRGQNEYWFPGGHLEQNESFEECAIRETKEETGITISKPRFLVLINEKAHGKHYVNVGMIAEWQSGDARVCEPETFENWEWYSPDNLPDPLFEIIPYYFKAWATGEHFFDA